MKSFVWYSPDAFEQAGHEVPSTFEDMLALTEQIAQRRKGALVCRHHLR